MLDPWIIEEILKKEQEQRRESELGRIELPIERHRDNDDKEKEHHNKCPTL